MDLAEQMNECPLVFSHLHIFSFSPSHAFSSEFLFTLTFLSLFYSPLEL